MGFSDLEKDGLLQMIRSEEIVDSLRSELPDNILNFLRQEDLYSRVRDYAFMPTRPHRLKQTENVTLHLYFNNDLVVGEVIEELMNVLAPGYRIKISYGFVMYNDQSKLSYRFFILYRVNENL